MAGFLGFFLPKAIKAVLNLSSQSGKRQAGRKLKVTHAASGGFN
jgi:hypothetical protein